MTMHTYTKKSARGIKQASTLTMTLEANPFCFVSFGPTSLVFLDV